MESSGTLTWSEYSHPHTVILYFTTLMNNPMLNQMYIAGGHLGGGSGAGNDGSDEGQWWRAAEQDGRRWCQQQQQRQAVGGCQLWSPCVGSGSGIGEEEAVVRGIGFGRSLYILWEKQCSAKVLCIVAPRSTFFCSREHFFAPGGRFPLWSAFFGSDNLTGTAVISSPQYANMQKRKIRSDIALQRSYLKMTHLHIRFVKGFD